MSKEAKNCLPWYSKRSTGQVRPQDLTAPADGKGLPQFKVTVTDGQLDVDLNADARTAAHPRPRRPSTTSSTTTGPPAWLTAP
jgi:hypothetical protein